MPPSEVQDDGRADAARTYRIRPATMADSPAIRRFSPPSSRPHGGLGTAQ